MLQTRIPLAACAALALVFLPAASPEAQQQKPAPPSVSQQDVDFVHEVARGAMLQIGLSKVASEQADTPAVKQFAQKTIQSLSKASDKLKSIAQSLGVDLPQQPPDNVRNLRAALADLSGSRLETEYTWNMLAASTVAVNLFEDEVDDGENDQLVQFAQNMLPRLRKHRDQAAQVWRTLQ
jgi:putative membrane protein